MPSERDRRILNAALVEVTELVIFLGNINPAMAEQFQQEQERLAARLKALQKDSQ